MKLLPIASSALMVGEATQRRGVARVRESDLIAAAILPIAEPVGVVSRSADRTIAREDTKASEMRAIDRENDGLRAIPRSLVEPIAVGRIGADRVIEALVLTHNDDLRTGAAASDLTEMVATSHGSDALRAILAQMENAGLVDRREMLAQNRDGELRTVATSDLSEMIIAIATSHDDALRAILAQMEVDSVTLETPAPAALVA
jgi:hypothetical protein